jgi:hypothetical protein
MNYFNSKFIKEILPVALFSYFVLSIIISVISYNIGANGWENKKNQYKVNIQPENSLIDYNAPTSAEKLIEVRRQENEMMNNDFIRIFNKVNQTQAEMDLVKKHDVLIWEIKQLMRDSSYRASVAREKEYSGLAGYKSPIEQVIRVPENIISFENINAINQPFLFRSFYAFFSEIYLTRIEQNNSGTLFINLASSTFISLFLVFFFALLIYYIIKRSF